MGKYPSGHRPSAFAPIADRHANESRDDRTIERFFTRSPVVQPPSRNPKPKRPWQQPEDPPAVSSAVWNPCKSHMNPGAAGSSLVQTNRVTTCRIVKLAVSRLLRTGRNRVRFSVGPVGRAEGDCASVSPSKRSALIVVAALDLALPAGVSAFLALPERDLLGLGLARSPFCRTEQSIPGSDGTPSRLPLFGGFSSSVAHRSAALPAPGSTADREETIRASPFSTTFGAEQGCRQQQQHQGRYVSRIHRTSPVVRGMRQQDLQKQRNQH